MTAVWNPLKSSVTLQIVGGPMGVTDEKPRFGAERLYLFYDIYE